MTDDKNPIHRKSLREILPKSGSRKTATRRISSTTSEDAEEFEEMKTEEKILRKRRSGKVPKKLIWGIAIILILIIIVAGSSFFTRVEAVISPQQERVVPNSTITAVLSGDSSDLKFSLASNEIKATVNVPASGEDEVERKASGEITIFNEFSTEDQLLVATTRFKTSDGKIYRVQKPVTIPGQKTSSGTTTPGQVTVTVFADKAGEEYNISSAEFTIPGFENTPRFDGFYAKTVGPLTGGFVGIEKTVSEDDREKAEATLESSLETKADQIDSIDVPDTHIALAGKIFKEFTVDQLESADADQVTLQGTIKASVIVFKKSDLASYLANKYISSYEGEPVYINNFDNLKIVLNEEGEEEIKGIEALNSVDIDLSGDALIVWRVDEEKLKSTLAGYSKSTYQTAIADFLAIKSIKLKFTPPWISSIPSDPDKINIVQIIGE